MTTIGAWLRGHEDLDRLDCELLLAEALGRTRAQILAHPEHPLEEPVLAQLAQWAARLRDHEPLAYLTGRKEFWGIEFTVTSDVLIPRPETELLVELAIDLVCARKAHEPVRILDLGTGCGAIAVALALSLKERATRAAVTACDRSLAVIRVARANAARHDADIRWLVSDWFSDVPRGFDVIVSNPPYVAVGDPHLIELGHEPAEALCAGIDGLDALRVIVPAAHEHLAPGGWLLAEHGYNQSDAVEALFNAGGYVHVSNERDLAGQPRVTLGQRRPDTESVDE